MERLILSLLLSFVLSFNANAGMRMFGGGMGVSAATCDTTNILFWWRMENIDLNGDCVDTDDPYDCCAGEDAGTCDYSAGDTTGTAGGGATVTVDAVKYGVYGLDAHANYHQITFDTPSATLDENGHVGFWFRIVSFVDESGLFDLAGDGNNSFTIRMDGTDDATGREIKIVWRRNGGNEVSTSSTDADLAENTWYWMDAYWNVTADTIYVDINGVNIITSTATITDFTVAVASIIWGNWLDVAGDVHIDNGILSDESTDDFYTICKDETEYPG